MSFNRLTYDNCSYKTNLSENISQLSYLLDTVKYENCSKCRNELGLVGGTNVSQVAGNLVDLESDLFNIDRSGSKCPTMKYLPSSDGYVQGKPGYKPVCYPKIDTNMKHLRPCQFVSYRETPLPPSLDLYKCPKQ